MYKCIAKDLTIESVNETITNIEGIHKAQKSSNDVNILIVENQIFHHFPKGLDRSFPKVYHLDVNNSSLKAVTQDDMKMFPNLRHLYLRKNQIDVLPNNLFQQNPLLSFINLDNNRIKQVAVNLFEPLTQLISLSIENNDCIDGFALQEEPLRILIEEISKNCSLHA